MRASMVLGQGLLVPPLHACMMSRGGGELYSDLLLLVLFRACLRQSLGMPVALSRAACKLSVTAWLLPTSMMAELVPDHHSWLQGA